MTAECLVKARDIFKSFGGKKALDGVSLDLSSGQIHVLLGRNGSGKTTLVKILSGILRPDSGQVISEGFGDGSIQRNIGFLFDSSAHWTALSGFENAWFYARSFGLSAKDADARISSLFGQLSLTETSNDPVSSYSFGMKRKLALVQALVHDPGLVVLDEPSIGLDYASRTILYDILRSRALSGKVVVIATNDMNEAKLMANTVTMLERGRVIASGSPSDLIGRLARKTVISVELKEPIHPDLVHSIPGTLGASLSEGKDGATLQIIVESNREHETTADLMSLLESKGVSPSRIEFRRPDLGDVFLEYSGVESR